MRLAVLGVGLIGGSIGLAARRRLDAEVAGFDSDPRNAERALELGALDRAAASIAGGGRGRRDRLLRGPDRRPARLWSPRPSEASGDDVVVTDVGSTKEALLAGIAGERAQRFIGGHPLAGAETAGVENARADLFEGARWYLTPTERSSGVHYDRLQRTIADLGARPQAIDAETHDRLMATVSHVPHVIANVLVQEAAAAADEESERLPEVGPSFRDTARVAGANPAIWGDIFATNREAVAREVEAVSERLREAAELIRSGRRRARWPRGTGRRSRGSPAPARDRPRRRRAARAPGGGREPAGDRGRDRPRPRPGPGQHRGHGPLPGAGHAHRRRDPVGRRGARRPIGRPGSSASSATRCRFPSDALRSLGPAARSSSATARQVDQPSGGADRRHGGGGDGGRQLSRRRRHQGHPRGDPGAGGGGHGDRGRSGGRPADPRGRPSRRRAGERSTSATPGRCFACFPAGLRASARARGPSTATSRSAVARSTASPSRSA